MLSICKQDEQKMKQNNLKYFELFKTDAPNWNHRLPRNDNYHFIIILIYIFFFSTFTRLLKMRGNFATKNNTNFDHYINSFNWRDCKVLKNVAFWFIDFVIISNMILSAFNFFNFSFHLHFFFFIDLSF